MLSMFRASLLGLQWGPPAPPSQPPTPDEEEEDRGREDEEEEVSGRREERRKTAVSLYSCRGGEGGQGGPSTADSGRGRERKKKNITSGVGTARRCAGLLIADHRGLGLAGEVAARGLVEGSAAGGAYHWRPPGVSVEQQQGLVVAFDTARHHVLPLRADLERHRTPHSAAQRRTAPHSLPALQHADSKLCLTSLTWASSKYIHLRILVWKKKTQAGPQAVDDVLRQVRVVRVPHQPDGHDLRRVHQHPADTQHLPTVTLGWRNRKKKKKEKGHKHKPGSSSQTAQCVS
ncbi:hypothetical protein EYF80_021341 [Liparis tanakae]|uniref:Uncharacterized protein n=1 Tax=Liparis tanakae TaxID=230148 RepID=A0A4Z2HS10_9TELE|nr:hypothetical protein EYF80_021341 [Liparis tanakae]